MIDTLPPEIFAHVLKIAIETWGIGFLPPVCRVSWACHDLVVSTPSLWGIFTIDRKSSSSQLIAQLAKAKASDLTIIASRRGGCGRKALSPFLTGLVALAPNWVRGDMSIGWISLTRWADLSRLEILALSPYRLGDETPTAATFFGTADARPKLHTFTARSLPEEWVEGFLNPQLKHFDLSYLDNIPVSRVQRYFSLIPHIHTIHLRGIMFRPLSSLNSTVTLANLSNLELVNIRHPTSLLLDLHAPALQTLVIRNSRMDMGAFLSQWSHADFLPSNLRSLEFTECFSETHMPYLIRWLARLPSLLRLVLTHKDDIGDPNPLTSSVETDIFKALSSPDGAGSVVGGWLCPSLVHLCVDTNLRVVDIIPIARARGGAAARSSGLPSRLRLMQATLCSSGTEDEIAEFRSFFAEDSDAICLCLACGFNFSI